MQNVIYAVIGVIFLVMGATQVTPSISEYIQAKKADNLAQKEKSIFDAVKRYITIKGTVPANAQALVDAGFISSEAFSDNGWGTPITLDVNNTTGIVAINTDIPNSYAKTSYMQNWKNWIKPLNTTGNTVKSSFVIPTDVLHGNSGGLLTGAYIGTTAPDSTKYTYWYDTSTNPSSLKMYNGSAWAYATKSPITTTNTVTQVSSLPTTGVSNGDERYVYNASTKTVDTYTYYGTSWSMTKSGGSSTSNANRCRTNWVFVPNSQGLYDSPKGWCVMKYEASPWGSVGYTMSYNAMNWEDANDANLSKKVFSGIGHSTLNMVSSTNARSICSENHLVDSAGNTITGGVPLRYNTFWNLARDIASNPVNWSGGAVGSGYLYSGHSDNSPANAIPPSTNDADPYSGTGQTSGNQKRVLYTTQGDAIWDLAGNLWEQMYEQQNIGSTDGFKEYTSITTNAFAPQYIMGTVATNWNSTYGVGQSYGTGGTTSSLAVQGSYRLLRGASWDGSSNAGLFTSHWGTTSLSYRDTEVGVRCMVPAQ